VQLLRGRDPELAVADFVDRPLGLLAGMIGEWRI